MRIYAMIKNMFVKPTKIIQFSVGCLLSVLTSCTCDKQDEQYGKITCDTSNVQYRDIQIRLETQCYGCHTESAPSGNVIMYDYQSLKTLVNNDKGTLLASIKHTTASAMPKGGQKWDVCNIEKLEAWINQGMKP